MAKIFREIKARKQSQLDCGHIVPVSENYWRCGQETICEGCKKRITGENDNWEDFFQFANENISKYARQYGRTSDYEQILVADYERIHPNVIFLSKEQTKKLATVAKPCIDTELNCCG